MLRVDNATQHAIRHTLHCLTGCSIGEILGSAIGAHFVWPNALQTLLAVLLAFLFGYLLTFRGALNMGMTPRDAAWTAVRVDTISITSMEIVDNTIEYLIPGAMNAVVASWLFWWSLAVSLAVAFLVTVSVNFWFMARGSSREHHLH